MSTIPNNLQVARLRPEQSRVAKQNVPAFLNKLATMVSDSETDDLIRWSDDGESFFVPNHERFGRELLPKFFKHGNFSSFVRQLNMYGFHKVPHLQQGVLKNETENELWQFSNPNFKRNFPDLLPLIARKKGTLNIEERDENGNIIPGADGIRTSAGPLDLHAIANGITSIRRHQNAISNELKELQNSNSALWQEALAARERHQQHQETINKILRFLAGVFGPNAGMGMNGSPTSPTAPGAHRDKDTEDVPVLPRKRQRLMLEGRSPSTKPKGKRKAPTEEDEESSSPVSPTATDAHRFTEVTPSESNATPKPEAAEATPTLTTAPPLNIKRSPSDQVFSPSLLSRSRTPIAPTASSTNQPDHNHVFNATLQALLNSPNSAHRLLASLAGMPQGGAFPPGVQVPPAVDQQQAQLQPFMPYPGQPGVVPPYPFPFPGQNIDFSMLPPIPPTYPPGTQPYPSVPGSGAASAPNTSNTVYQPTAQDTQHAQMLQSVAQNSAGLQRAYKDTEAIEADVDALQESINSLINSLGIDPNTIQVPTQEEQPPAHVDETTQAQNGITNEGPEQPDFDIEAFLNSLDANTSGAISANTPQHYDAFFDELSSQGTSSPKDWAGAAGPGMVDIPPLPTVNATSPTPTSNAPRPPAKKRKTGK